MHLPESGTDLVTLYRPNLVPKLKNVSRNVPSVSLMSNLHIDRFGGEPGVTTSLAKICLEWGHSGGIRKQETRLGVNIQSHAF